MNYFFSIFLFLMIGCEAQSVNKSSAKMEFEEVSHFPYALTSAPYLILDTQDKIDSVYKIIHSNAAGKRLAPIPTIQEDETYVVLKPVLKNSNDIQIKEISLLNNNLYVDVDAYNDPQIKITSRVSPNVLVKVLKKISPKKIIINYQKNNSK